MTPQLQQAIRLLQLSTLELQQVPALAGALAGVLTWTTAANESPAAAAASWQAVG